MNGVVIEQEQGFEKVVFESVIDTLAGGVCIDPTGQSWTNDIIPAGTLIGIKDPATGLAKPVTISSPGGSATFSPAPLGFLRQSIKASDSNPLGSVVIEGVVRLKALPATYQQSATPLKAALPKITLV